MTRATEVRGPKGEFPTTHWSVVLDAAKGQSNSSANALEKLCRAYWYPLYAFARRRGLNACDAEDSIQSFFEHLLQKHNLRDVDREKGKFRTFLLTSLTNFLNSQWAGDKARKRGGNQRIISWDSMEAAERYRQEPAHDSNPEKLFEQRWAFAVLDEVLGELRQRYEAAGKLLLFETLQPHLTQEPPAGCFTSAGERLGFTEGALRVALHRLRRRFGAMLRDHLIATVGNSSEIDEEIRNLCAALSI